MGGLAVNVSQLHDRLDKILLTPSGLIYLAEKGYFFEISDSDIQDKSKASWLAKGFVLLQITWTILQCLSRKVVGLPISVLEVHVLVQAGCALIMYGLWFNKPKDIDEPTDVTSKIPEKIIALMLVQNHYFGTQPYRELDLPIEYRPIQIAGKTSCFWPRNRMSEAAYLMYNPQPPSSLSSGNTPNQLQEFARDSQPVSASLQPSLTLASDSALPLQSLQANAGARPIHQSAVSEDGSSAPQAKSSTSEISLSSSIPRHLSSMPEHVSCVGQALQSTSSGSPSAAPGSSPATLIECPSDPGSTFYGFTWKPAPGVRTIAIISTGQFLENGIGPSVQLPNSLRRRLPLDRFDTSTISHYFPLTVSLSGKDIRRWQLAGSVLREELKPSATQLSENHPFLGFESSADTIRGAYFIRKSSGLDIAPTWTEALYHRRRATHDSSGIETFVPWGLYRRLLETEEVKLGPPTAVMTLIGLLYGGLHLTLWDYKFPTHAEGLLWRLSATALLAESAGIAIFVTGRAMYRKRKKARGDITTNSRPTGENSSSSSSSHSADDLPSMILVLALAWALYVASLYFFSRVFIIVESFISLRHVPIGVYTDVGWSKYIPHM
ncbi:MAG: hypothetical protein Q9200_003705 [Gallowayella weberi]